MRSLRPEPTRIAEWQSLVLEAQMHTGYEFDEALESYLVLTLDKFMHQGDLTGLLLAIDFLENIELSSRVHAHGLRKTGDHCLLLSGLFPERALTKNVSLGYFIDLGQQAYAKLAISPEHFKLDTELFYQLSENFVGLMDILHTMRTMEFRYPEL